MTEQSGESQGYSQEACQEELSPVAKAVRNAVGRLEFIRNCQLKEDGIMMNI